MLNIDSATNKITFAGDWHGSYPQATNVLAAAYQRGSDVILQLGDFGIWHDDEKFLEIIQKALETYNQRLYFIDGNHENFHRLYAYPIDPETGLRPIRPNIFHLPRGTRFTINHVRFLALGGAYSVDRRYRKLNKSYWLEEEVTEDDITRALAVPDPTTDILLMHDSPYPAPNPITDNPLRQSQGIRSFGHEAIEASSRHRHALTPVFTQSQPYALFHGHYHEFWAGQHIHSSGKMTRVIALDEGGAPLIEHAHTIDFEKLLTQIQEEGHHTPNDLP